MTHQNLLPGPDPTFLPEDGPDAIARAAMAGGSSVRDAIPSAPAASLLWALLAEESLAASDPVAAYAYARTGYHRGLDALRGAGWKGHGPIPWEHEPNRGFLRSLNALGLAATQIGEQDEATRCAIFLRESSPEAAAELGA